MPTVFSNAGKQWVVDKIQDAGTGHGIVGAGAIAKWVGWGTGAGTTSVADTTLFLEASEARINGTPSTQTTDSANDTYQVLATMIANGSKDITNAAVFDNATGGTMLIKGDFAAIPVIINDTIDFTFKLNFDD